MHEGIPSNIQREKPINPLEAVANDLRGYIDSRNDAIKPEERERMDREIQEGQEGAEKALEAIMPELPDKIRSLYGDEDPLYVTLLYENMTQEEEAEFEKKDPNGQQAKITSVKQDILVSRLNEEFAKYNLPVRARAGIYLGSSSPQWRVSIEKKRGG